MKVIFPLATLLVLAACTTVPISSRQVRTDGLATFGQPTRVGPLIITPQALAEDSRCPVNARCIWAGRVVLRTRVDGPGWRETAMLTLGLSYATHGFRFALISAEPGKIAGSPSLSASLFGFAPR